MLTCWELYWTGGTGLKEGPGGSSWVGILRGPWVDTGVDPGIEYIILPVTGGDRRR